MLHEMGVETGVDLPALSSPKLDSKLVTPACSAASALARPAPRVLWKWAVSCTAPSAG